MSGKIKALGLAFIIITAMSAVSASAAQAEVLDVGAQPAVLTGINEPGQIHKSGIEAIPVPAPPDLAVHKSARANICRTGFAAGNQSPEGRTGASCSKSLD
jgi:hypothetical protein